MREEKREEVKKTVQELGILLSRKLQNKLERLEDSILMLDIQLPSVDRKLIIKELVKASTIDIPIHLLARGIEFSEEDLDAIKELKEIKVGFELTQEELAELLKVSPRTVAYWLHFDSSPRLIARDRIAKVYKVYQEIREEVRPEALRKWLFAHNKLLGDRVYALLVKGQFEKVLADIEAIKEGVYV